MKFLKINLEVCTFQEEFQLLCFPEVVLKNVLSALNDLRGDSLKVGNNTIWLAAYKQYKWWLHSYLGVDYMEIFNPG